jgi:hypothetical protein
MTYPVFIFWLLFLRATVASERTLFILLFTSFTFGALAVLPPELTGGSSFLPKTMFACLIVVRFVVIPLIYSPQRLIELLRLDHLGFLLAFLLISLITTMFMPRLFENAVDVIPLKFARFASSEALTPTMANMTQSIYLTISVAATVGAAMISRSPRFSDNLLTAIRIGGIVLLGSGLLDMLANAIGQADALEPFKNASYAMITNAEIAGVRRVVGLMPEASSYGSTCVSFIAMLAFCRPLYAPGWPRFTVSMTILALITMALVSTSSSAYAGLAFFGAAYLLNLGRRMFGGSATSQIGLRLELTIGFLAIVVLLFVTITNPDVFDPLLRIVDEIIFNKASSDSYMERTFWTQVSWSAFWSTYGLGVGLGGTRASNYFVAVISNTGFLSSICFFVFLLQVFFRRLPSCPKSREMIVALRFSILPILGTAALGSATPDFEAMLGVLFGAIMGLSLRQTKERAPQIVNNLDTQAINSARDFRGEILDSHIWDVRTL